MLTVDGLGRTKSILDRRNLGVTDGGEARQLHRLYQGIS